MSESFRSVTATRGDTHFIKTAFAGYNSPLWAHSSASFMASECLPYSPIVPVLLSFLHLLFFFFFFFRAGSFENGRTNRQATGRRAHLKSNAYNFKDFVTRDSLDHVDNTGGFMTYLSVSLNLTFLYFLFSILVNRLWPNRRPFYLCERCAAQRNNLKKMTKCRGDFFSLVYNTHLLYAPRLFFCVLPFPTKILYFYSLGSTSLTLWWCCCTWCNIKSACPPVCTSFFFLLFLFIACFSALKPPVAISFFFNGFIFLSNGSIDFAMLRIACRQKTRGHGQTQTQKTKNASGESQWFYWMGKLR